MATKILQIVGNLGNEVYTQNDEPVNAKDGALWVDLDDEGIATDIKAALAEAKASGEFKGEKGDSGVYVGSGEMPEGYNVQIDPNGDVIKIPTKTSELENDSEFVTRSELGVLESQDEETMDAITEMGLVEPVALSDGSIITSNNNEIYCL